MATFCKKCGTQAIDDKSIFCQKCGNSLQENLPNKKSSISQSENQISNSPTYSDSVPQRPSRKSREKPKREVTEISKFFSFDKFITKKVVSIIYILGTIAITLISLGIIVSGFLKPQTSISSVNNTLFSPVSSANDTFYLPIVGIGILVFGNLFWRILCEIFVVLFKINDTLITIENALLSEDEGVDHVECPHCSSEVRKDQLRECDSCGVVGCEKCIKKSGLVKKTMTCKSCFENK